MGSNKQNFESSDNYQEPITSIYPYTGILK